MNPLIKRIVSTRAEYAPLAARLALGVMIFPHGAQKLLGWFGGPGFEGTMGFFTSQGIPYVFALLAIAAEFFGGLGLITGLFTRIAAFGVGCNMLVAIAMVHGPNGFFMNWSGKQAGEGFEFHILALGLAVSLILSGGGAFSLDRLIDEKARGN